MMIWRSVSIAEAKKYKEGCRTDVGMVNWSKRVACGVTILSKERIAKKP